MESSGPHPIGKVPPALQLDPTFRMALYAVLAALTLTGIGWLVADELKEGASSELWQSIAVNLLMLHGGSGMIVLVMFGALLPLHVRLGWRASRNRLTGSVMVTCMTLLTISAFGLYYIGHETARDWSKYGHIGIGLALPILIVFHIALGRRTARQIAKD